MSTQVTTTSKGAIAPKPKNTIQTLLNGERFAETLKSVLPTYLTPKTFVQIVCTQLKKCPKLAKCEPIGFFGKLQEVAERGLAPNGRDAYLIPFDNHSTGVTECQLIIGYQGKVKLAKKYGGVKRIYCELWCKGDTLTNDTGVIHHIIDYTKPRDEASALGCVCIVYFTDSPTEIGQGVVVPKAEINAVRDRTQSYRSAKRYNSDCPWISSWGEMAKKTAFNRLCKWLDLSPEFEAAAEETDTIDADFTEVAAEMPQPRKLADSPKLDAPKHAPKLAAPEPVRTDAPKPLKHKAKLADVAEAELEMTEAEVAANAEAEAEEAARAAADAMEADECGAF